MAKQATFKVYNGTEWEEITFGSSSGTQMQYYGTCATASGTAAKVVTCSGFTLTTGVSINVKFTYYNGVQSGVTLNVNGTGAKSIKSYGSTVETDFRYRWRSGAVVGFTYDGTNWIIEQPAGASTSYYGLSRTDKTTLNGSQILNPSFYAPTSAGTSGQVLVSNGSGAPTWQTLSGGGTVSGDYLPLTGGTIDGDFSVGREAFYVPGGGNEDGNIYSIGGLRYNNVGENGFLFEESTGAPYILKDGLYIEFQNTEGEVALLQDIPNPRYRKYGSNISLSANGYTDLQTFMNVYHDCMFIVRLVCTASTTVGISNSTSTSSSGFLTSKSFAAGTHYIKIVMNKTDQSQYAWDINGTIGWTSDTAYRYLRNYASSGTVTMTVVAHSRF